MRAGTSCYPVPQHSTPESLKHWLKRRLIRHGDLTIVLKCPTNCHLKGRSDFATP